MIELNLRPASALDLPFIYSTWLRNYRHSSTGFAQAIDKEIYYEFHHLVIGRIIDRGASLLVASDKVDASVIYGYLVWERLPNQDVVQYAYVKKAFRGLGICTDLIREAGLRTTALLYTHQTDQGKKFANKDREGWICKYHPYLI
jgi:hypothetical protein